MESFAQALSSHKPLKIIGVINAYVAKMAEANDAPALYISGAGVANYAWGLPDQGVTTLENVAEEVKRIRSASRLPLLVDMDTGWERIEEAVRTLTAAGASAIHIEDQIPQKRCGHLSGKEVVSIEEMVVRLKAAKFKGLFLVARTDAYEKEGLEGVIKRAQAYEKAGAEMLFADALPSLEDFIRLKKSISLPVLINQTEFGVTPLYPFEKIKDARLDAVLYPLSLARGMMGEALRILKEIVQKGDVTSSLPRMQPRKELYEYLDT